jgi:bla regulator protein blaR1
MSGRERFHESLLALQALLADRFQLQISQETRSIPVYALVVAKTGAKFAPSAPQLDGDGKPKAERNHSIRDSNGHMTAIATSMSGLADWFVHMPECDRVVFDRTGLTGEYDLKLDWTRTAARAFRRMHRCLVCSRRCTNNSALI